MQKPCAEGGANPEQMATRASPDNVEGACVHLIHMFIRGFTKCQLLDLKTCMEERGRVDLGGFFYCIFQASPDFMFPTLNDDTRKGRSAEGSNVVQAKLVAELFKQLDAQGVGEIGWSDLSTLLFNMSGMKVKQAHLYSDQPMEPVFSTIIHASKSDEPSKTSHAFAPQRSLGPSVADLKSGGDSIFQDRNETVEFIGKKVRGVGFYFSEVDCLKYFQAMKVHALAGGLNCYLFTYEGSTATVISKLYGPTAAIFNIYHFPTLAKILVLCADRYLYCYNDNFSSGAPTERLKVATAQLSASWDPVERLLFTGGTDGAVLVFAAGPGNKLAYTQRIEVAQEWVCDLLHLRELDQLLTCTADGKTSVWDISWEGGKREETGMLVTKLRAVKDTHGRSVKTQVAYSMKYKMLFSIGHGHDVMCWNSYITSQSHLLRGHEKLLVKIHAFDHTSEVISADACGKIIVWDVRSLTAIQTLGGPDSHCAIGPLTTFVYNEHKRALVTVGRRFCVFPCNSKEENSMFSSKILQVLYSEAQGVVITLTPDRVFLWHAATGELHKAFSDFSVCDLTCATLVNKESDLAVANAEGEVRFLSLLNGMWQDAIEPMNDAIVSIVEVAEQSSWLRKLFKAKHIYVAEGKAEAQVLFVATSKGVLSFLYFGKVGEPKLLAQFRSLLDTVAFTTVSDQHLACVSQRDCEVWSIYDQTLRRSIRCTSAITSAAFLPTVQAFVVAEELGVLHFYSYPGLAYLMRFSFMDHFAVTGMTFAPNCYQLVCEGAAKVKSVSLRSILSQYYENESMGICKSADCTLQGRYAVARGAKPSQPSRCLTSHSHSLQSIHTPRRKNRDAANKWKGGDAHMVVLGYDTTSRSRVSISRNTDEAVHIGEVRVLQDLQHTPEVVDMFDAFEEGGAHYTITESCDVVLMHYVQGGACIKRRGGMTEPNIVISSLASALMAVHNAGYVLFLSPAKVGRIRGVWKVVDLTGAVPIGETTDMSLVPWRDCPPECVPQKKAEQAEPTPVVDAWGLGLVLWLVYKRQHVWDGLSDPVVREKLMMYELAHRHLVIPDSLLSDSVMRVLLDGTLCKAERRWSANRVLDYLQANGRLHSAEDTYDLQPFPINRPDGEGVLQLKERGRFRLSRIQGEPSPQVQEDNPDALLDGMSLRKKSWFSNTDDRQTESAQMQTFITRVLLPATFNNFTTTAVVPHLNTAFCAEWNTTASVSTLSAFRLSLEDEEEGMGFLGSLPLRSTVEDLGLHGVDVPEDFWEFGELVDPMMRQQSCGMLTKERKQATFRGVLALGDGEGGQSQSLGRQRRKSIIDQAKRTSLFTTEDKPPPQHRHQEAPPLHSVADLPCSELSPFYTTRLECGESAGWVAPFYMKGNDKIEDVKQRALGTERVHKGQQRLMALQVERESKEVLDGNKRLGMDFLLATPRDNCKATGSAPSEKETWVQASIEQSARSLLGKKQLRQVKLGRLEEPAPALLQKSKIRRHKRAPLYSKPFAMIDRSLLSSAFTPQDRQQLHRANSILKKSL